MAISIRSVTQATMLAGSATISLTTSESPSATQVGDLVVVFHGNNFYTLANMATPTATGSPTVTAIPSGAVDGGTDDYHAKSYTYVANTGGAQTVSITETGAADEEKALAVYVLAGADTSTPIDVAGGTDGTPAAAATDPNVLTGISPSTTNAFLISYLFTGNTILVTPPGSMTEDFEVNGAPQFTHEGAHEQLSASGATGTRSFDLAEAHNFVGLLVAIKTAAAGGPAADTSNNPLRLQPKIIGNPFIGDIGRGPGVNVTTFPRQPAIPMVLWADTETAAVGTSYPVAQTDSVGLTDSAVLDQGKVFTDSVGLTDAAVLDRSLVYTDSAGLTDTTAFTVSPVYTDSAGLTDTSTIQSGKTVTTTDSAGLADAAVLDRALVYTDSAGLTDAALLTRALVYTDSAGLTDTSTVQASKLITQSDDAGLSDGVFSYDIDDVHTDSAGLTDTSLLARGLVYTDSAGLTDTSTIQAAKLITQTDSAGLTDAGLSFDVTETLTDSVGLTDAATLTRSLVYTDSAGLTDTSSISSGKILTQTDSAGLTDAATLDRALVYTDSAGLADTAIAGASTTLFTDSAGLTDAAALTVSKVVTDSAGLTDTSSISSGKLLDLTDSTGLTDARIISQTNVLTDSAGLTDTTAFAVSKVLSDSAGLTDTSLVSSPRDVTATDSVGLTDSRVLGRGIGVEDSVGLTDGTAFAQLRVIITTDSAGLTDAATAVPVSPFPYTGGPWSSDPSPRWGAESPRSRWAATPVGG